MKCHIKGIKKIVGTSYDDILISNGNGTLSGGAGIDTFEITNYPGLVTIQDFEIKNYEKINVSQFTEVQSFDELQVETISEGTKITLPNDVQIQLDNVVSNDLEPEHFIFYENNIEEENGLSWQAWVISVGIAATVITGAMMMRKWCCHCRKSDKIVPLEKSDSVSSFSSTLAWSTSTCLAGIHEETSPKQDFLDTP